MDAGAKLGRGLAIIVEALLKVSMLKPAQEETIPQCIRPRVSIVYMFLFSFISNRIERFFPPFKLRFSYQLPSMTLDGMPDYAADDSSTGEYVTADDGYEADVEIPGRSPHSNIAKRSNSLGPVIEPRGHANAHPALCSLAVDLLIHFTEQSVFGYMNFTYKVTMV